jgi:Uma2 family endonuclease
MTLVIATKPSLPPRPEEPRRWTFDEVAAELPETNLPTELWDGELVMSPAPSFFHQTIVARFYKLLDAWVAPRGLGQTGFAPLDMILTERQVVQPDVFFVSKERLAILTDRLRGAPDLVVEVLSPGTRRRDRLDKRDLYEQHGVREYWLIDPDAQTVEVLFLERGEYLLVGRWQPDGQAASRLLKGFEVPVGDLLESTGGAKGQG